MKYADATLKLAGTMFLVWAIGLNFVLNPFLQAVICLVFFVLVYCVTNFFKVGPKETLKKNLFNSAYMNLGWWAYGFILAMATILAIPSVKVVSGRPLFFLALACSAALSAVSAMTIPVDEEEKQLKPELEKKFSDPVHLVDTKYTK